MDASSHQSSKGPAMPTRPLRRFAVAAIFALTCTPAFAQNFPTAVVLPVSGTPSQMVTADFNGDGHADIAYQDAYTGGNLHVLLGRGDGTFSVGQVIPLPVNVGTYITVGDINGDGLPDLAFDYDGFATSGGTAAITILLGKGDGTFSAPISSPTSGSGSPVTIYFKVGIADFDGDGHPDLIYSSGNSLYLMKGDGSGHLAKEQPIATGMNFTGDVLVTDLNGDGQPDVIVSGGSSIAVLLNKSGSLTVASTYPIAGGYSPGQGSLGLADIDGDGHPDIFFGDFSGTISALSGHADGTFGPITTIGAVPNHYPSFLGVSDLHGDHKPRIVAASYDGVSTLLGATPASAPLYAAAGGNFYEGAIADFNGDGYADIAMPGDQSIVLLLGKPDGTFAAAPSYQTGNYVGGLTVLDDTGDNIPDVILSSSEVFAGKGDGTFPAKPVFPGGSVPFLLYSGDFDGNGHLGFYANTGIYRNNGDGTFTPQPLLVNYFGQAVFPTYFAAIADFNRDGRADVALSASQGGSPSTTGNAVYIENSTVGGLFTTTALNFAEPVGPLGAGDFDGDGCPDLAVGAATQVEIFKGDCKGNFTPVASYLTGTGATVTSLIGGYYSSLEPSDIAVTDLDGDGHLDIVYTIPGLSLAKVLYGNGDGTFTAGADITLTHSSIYVTAADLDSDGHSDLVFTGQTIATIYHGNGTRTPGSPAFLAAGYKTGKAVVADLNLDGNPDIVIPNLDFDGGDNSNDNGFTFTVFLNPLAPRETNTLTATLTIAPEPSAFGQDFTATATFEPVNNPASPSGIVTFSIDGVSAGTSPLNSSGVATFTFSNAAVGTHIISAIFPGDSNFLSISVFRSHVVTGYPTSITLTSSLNPSVSTQNVTFTSTVTSANGTPTGSVQFTDGLTVLGTQTLGPSGTAMFSISTLSVGPHTIYAYYIPTGSFAGISTSIPQTVNDATFTVSIASSLNPSNYGQPVTFTVSTVPTNGVAVPGDVTFSDGSQLLGRKTVDASGTAAITLSTLSVGAHIITGAFTPNNSPHTFAVRLTQQVNSLPTTTVLTATPLTGVAHITPITLTATVAPATPGTPTPNGQVIFYINGAQFNIASLVNGVATYTGTLPAGVDQIYAVYGGDPNNIYNSSNSNTISVTITAAPSTLSFTSSLNPAPALTPFNLSAHLTLANGSAVGAGYPIIFTIAPATTTQATTNASSVATYTSPGLLPGQYLVTATFAGTTDLQPSTATSFIETVTANPTITTLTASPNPGIQNNPVTFTATVSATTGSSAPTGTISILDTTAAGTFTLATIITPASTGTTTTVTFTTSALAPGTHSLVAVFGPTVAFGPSQSAPLSLIIVPQSFTLTLSDPTLTIQTGHHRTETVSLTSIGGLTATFTHSCAALPIYVSCLWAQASVTLPPNGTVSTSLVMDTDQLPGFLTSIDHPANNPGAPFMARSMRHGWAATTAFALLPLTFFGFKRRRKLSSLLSLLLLATLATTLTACGADKYPGSTPPGTYIIPITASAISGGTTYTQTVNLTLVVTP
jgi:hypothetical protein